MSAHDPKFTERKPKPVIHECAKERHKDTLRILGYALILADGPGWVAFAAIAAARLTLQERVALASTSLLALDRQDSEAVVCDVFEGAGYPLPPIVSPMADARWWAELASRAELKAYAIAAYEALPPRDQQAFRRHIDRDRRVA